jgi:hypothetical protein
MHEIGILTVWKPTHAARPEDVAWQEHSIWAELQAPRSGAAMLADERRFQQPTKLISGQDRQVCSRSDNVKLYRIDRAQPPFVTTGVAALHEKRLDRWSPCRSKQD